MPTHGEGREIFGIHLRLRNRQPDQFELDALSRKTEGYTGADIKEVVQLGLKLAFHAGAELANDHLLAAIPEIRPLSKTDPELVTEVTKWLDSHTKPAGNGHNPTQSLNGNTLNPDYSRVGCRSGFCCSSRFCKGLMTFSDAGRAQFPLTPTSKHVVGGVTGLRGWHHCGRRRCEESTSVATGQQSPRPPAEPTG